MVKAENPSAEQQLSHELDASLAPVVGLYETIAADLANPQGVLAAVVATRLATAGPEAQLGIAPALLVDPSRSGVVAARYQMQEGRMPVNVDGTADQMLALWIAQKSQTPPLKVPEGKDDKLMALADELQMRGGGPNIYAREEADQLIMTEQTLIHSHGGARNANRERLESILSVLRLNPDYDRPVIATGDFGRQLLPAEREAVASFAPDAETELELLIASAQAKGFVSDGTSSRIFTDGTTRLAVMRHPDTIAPLHIVAPARLTDEKGKARSGVHNAYAALLKNPRIMGEDADLSGADLLVVTSTHYGAMALMNNLRANHELSFGVGSIKILGDNQPARNTQAHLIEVGFTVDSLSSLPTSLLSVVLERAQTRATE